MKEPPAPAAPAPPAVAPPPTTPPPGDKKGISPAAAALLGTVLGIAGSISTAVVAAHYTAGEHLADRAQARAKEHRDAVAQTYKRAASVLWVVHNTVQKRFTGRVAPASDAPSNELGENEVRDVETAIAMIGSKAALDAFTRAASNIFMMIEVGKDPSRADGAAEADAQFYKTYWAFVALARAELEGL